MSIDELAFLITCICQISAVSAKYNTTRDRALGILTKKDCQIAFYDTPGLIKPKYVLQFMALMYGSLYYLDVLSLYQREP